MPGDILLFWGMLWKNRGTTWRDFTGERDWHLLGAVRVAEILQRPGGGDRRSPPFQGRLLVENMRQLRHAAAMIIARLRCRLRHWLQQPTGLFAVVGLIVALVLTGIPRIEVHAHADGDIPHTSHVHDHEHAPNLAEQPAGEGVSHAHSSAVPATMAPAIVSLTPIALTSVIAATAHPVTLVLSSRPTELFRPPIA